tara:strand:+ start:695 stop:856 length:162 start_codon:yes stop_codon:yes gene_type:complete
MITVKITKTQRIDDRAVTYATELKGDAGEVLALLDELGHTMPLEDDEKTDTVH